MRPMAKSFGGFRAALLVGWMVLGVAGLVFARAKGIPLAAALPVSPLSWRNIHSIWWPVFRLCASAWPGRALPAILTGSLLLPYLLC